MKYLGQDHHLESPLHLPNGQGPVSRSVPASMSTFGPLDPRKASLNPSYQPRLHK